MLSSPIDPHGDQIARHLLVNEDIRQVKDFEVRHIDDFVASNFNLYVLNGMVPTFTA